MKKLIFVLPLMALILATISCNNFDDKEETKYYETMGTVLTGGDYPSFRTDNGVLLNCSTIVKTDSVFTPGERYYLYYTIGDTTTHAPKTYPIELHSFGRAIVKNFAVIEKDSSDIYYDQPLRNIYNFWISGNYINMMFYPFFPLTSQNSYELVRYKGKENTVGSDAEPVLYFEFRHHTSGIASNYTLRLVSFDLSPLVSEYPSATKFKIKLAWRDTQYGFQDYEFSYVPYDPS